MNFDKNKPYRVNYRSYNNKVAYFYITQPSFFKWFWTRIHCVELGFVRRTKAFKTLDELEQWVKNEKAYSKKDTWIYKVDPDKK